MIAAEASAQVQLSFSPADTTIAPDGHGRLSIMISDTLEVRTIDVHVSYDTTVVRSTGGGAGSLYTDSGLNTFQGFEEDTTGVWYGYAIILGYQDFIEGPGELYHWDFEAVGLGTTPVATVTIYLSTTDGSWFEDVTLPPTTITVKDPLSAAGPPVPAPADIQIFPNPFNPRTEVRYDLRRSGLVRLDVFDLRGGLVTTLLEGIHPAGPGAVTWDGNDRRGLAAPDGVYLFHLRTESGAVNTRGMLVK